MEWPKYLKFLSNIHCSIKNKSNRKTQKKILRCGKQVLNYFWKCWVREYLLKFLFVIFTNLTKTPSEFIIVGGVWIHEMP